MTPDYNTPAIAYPPQCRPMESSDVLEPEVKHHREVLLREKVIGRLLDRVGWNNANFGRFEMDHARAALVRVDDVGNVSVSTES
jgi:hypothetical protein